MSRKINISDYLNLGQDSIRVEETKEIIDTEVEVLGELPKVQKMSKIERNIIREQI